MKLLIAVFTFIVTVTADNSHLPSTDYLPPIQDIVPVEAPVSNFIPEVVAPAPAYVLPPAEAVPTHVLADDGYRYKTHRRVVYRRNRRDVSHLPSNEYLPPVPEAPVAVPSNEYLPPAQLAAPAPAPALVEAAPSHVLADDGYRYKTHRRVVYRRNRRDVSHLPSNEYLPPVQEASVAVPSNEYLPPVQLAAPAPAPALVEAAPSHILADDGYRYKTHRRVVYRRNRRDVSHLLSNEYLPPVQEAPVAIPLNEYLPPAQQAAPAPAPALVEAAPSHVLADDGYRYKTHRRVVYRRNRRDVSHLPSN